MSVPDRECTWSIHFFAMALMRRLYWEAQAGQCGICRGRMRRNFNSPKMTFDHVWPKAWIANCSDDARYLGNLLLSHDVCNKAKDDSKPSADQVEFLREINRKLGLAEHETSLWDRLG
jgi:hypothetical protein